MDMVLKLPPAMAEMAVQYPAGVRCPRTPRESEGLMRTQDFLNAAAPFPPQSGPIGSPSARGRHPAPRTVRLPPSKEACFIPGNNQAQVGDIGVAVGAPLNSDLAMFVQQTAVQLEARLDDQVALLGSSLNATLLKLVETTAVHFQMKLDAAMKYTDERVDHRMSWGDAVSRDGVPKAKEGSEAESAEPVEGALAMPREWLSEVDKGMAELDRRRLVDKQALEAEDNKMWQAMQALQSHIEQQLGQARMEMQQLMDQAEDGRRQLIESAATAADARTCAIANQSERLEQLAVKMRDGLSEEAKGRATLALALEQDLREEKDAWKARCTEFANKIAAHSKSFQVLADERAQEKQRKEVAFLDLERKLKSVEDALSQERSQREQGGHALMEQIAACRREVTDDRVERTNEGIDLRRDFQAVEQRQAQALKDLRKEAESEGAKRAVVVEQLERQTQHLADTLSAELAASTQAIVAAREEATRRLQELYEALEHERADREEAQAGMKAQVATRSDLGVERDARGQDVGALRQELQEVKEELAAKAGELHCRFDADGASRAHLAESAERDLRSLLDKHAAKLRTLSEGHERDASARNAVAEDVSHQLAEMSRSLQDERTRREQGDASVRAEVASVRSDLLEGQTHRSSADAELRNLLRVAEGTMSQQLQELRAEVDAVASRRADEISQEQQRAEACEEGVREATARSRAVEASHVALRESLEKLRTDSEAIRSSDHALAAESSDALRRHVLEQIKKDTETERTCRSDEVAEIRRSVDAMLHATASQYQLEELRRELRFEMRKESAAEQVSKLDSSIAEMGQEMVLFIEEQLRDRDAATAQLRRQQAVTDGVAKAVRKDLGLLRSAVISRLHVDCLDTHSSGLEMPFGLADCLAASLNKLQRGAASHTHAAGVRVAPGTTAAAGAANPAASPRGLAHVPESGAAAPLSVACLEAKLAALDSTLNSDRINEAVSAMGDPAVRNGSTAVAHTTNPPAGSTTEPPSQPEGTHPLTDLVSSVQKAFAASLAGTLPQAAPPTTV